MDDINTIKRPTHDEWVGLCCLDVMKTFYCLSIGQDDVDQGVHIADIHCAIAVEVGKCRCIGVIVASQDDVDADVHVGNIHCIVAVQVAK